jgi:hypothetical protein
MVKIVVSFATIATDPTVFDAMVGTLRGWLLLPDRTYGFYAPLRDPATRGYKGQAFTFLLNPSDVAGVVALASNGRRRLQLPASSPADAGAAAIDGLVSTKLSDGSL